MIMFFLSFSFRALMDLKYLSVYISCVNECEHLLRKSKPVSPGQKGIALTDSTFSQCADRRKLYSILKQLFYACIS